MTFFFHALAPVVRMMCVEPVYFALYALSHFATLAAIYALGLTLSRSPTAAFVACFLSIGQVPSLGAELGWRDDAIASYREALRLDPSDATARAYLELATERVRPRP